MLYPKNNIIKNYYLDDDTECSIVIVDGKNSNSTKTYSYSLFTISTYDHKRTQAIGIDD